ncbi:hypothetical protein HX017_18230 [Myroides marinus]|uniref:hypothetical protein n=1 Tax=Myroides marinus TaxID=703342 RepID=UPI002574BFFE|nr:hypothetical protein [Myroides marinus]MDM1352575.1 hypothetical protein [Myroides marinus]MDM1356148.1 hypothetical protein [Myroides marinus]MDM1359780.1 hypothetical protein [Myroides marinus]MDM1366859.1 hypothetical protein [Myroides marinus]
MGAKLQYFHYNYSIYEVDVKFLNVNDFQDYLVTTRIEKKLLLKNIYKLSNDIIELYIENESLEYLKESEEIENSLPSDWKRNLSDRAIAQVKGGFICLRVEERKIRVYQEYYEIGDFNKAYNQNLCVWTNIRNLLRDIELIWRLVEKYYPDIRVDYFNTYNPNLLNEAEQKPFEYQFNHIFKGQGFNFFKYLFENFVVNGRGRNADISFLYRKLFDDGFIHAKPTPFMEWINQEYNLDIDKIKTLNEVKSVKRNGLYSTTLESFKSKE